MASRKLLLENYEYYYEAFLSIDADSSDDSGELMSLRSKERHLRTKGTTMTVTYHLGKHATKCKHYGSGLYTATSNIVERYI